MLSASENRAVPTGVQLQTAMPKKASIISPKEGQNVYSKSPINILRVH